MTLAPHRLSPRRVTRKRLPRRRVAPTAPRAIAVSQLPSAAILCGTERTKFSGYVYDAIGVRLQAKAGEIICFGARCTPTGGYIESTKLGDYAEVVAVNDTTFVGKAEVPSGSWAVLPAEFDRGFDRAFS